MKNQKISFHSLESFFRFLNKFLEEDNYNLRSILKFTKPRGCNYFGFMF